MTMSKQSFESVNPNLIPSVPNSSYRNVNSIVETTNNLIQTLESYSVDNSGAINKKFEEKKGKGIKVEELINKFKNEARFDTMSKKKEKRIRTEEGHSAYQ